MVIYLAGLGHRAGGDRGGRRARRRRNRGAVLARHATVDPAVDRDRDTLGSSKGLRVFDQIMALTNGGPGGATETLATQVYKQAFALGNFGFGAALALVLTAIILFFAVLQQRLATATRQGLTMFRYTKPPRSAKRRLDRRAVYPAAVLLPGHHRPQDRRRRCYDHAPRAAEPAGRSATSWRC